MLRNTFFLLIVLSCVSCRKSEDKFLSANDTTAIFNTILNDREFLKETIHIDTLFFLKTKFYNKSWTKQSTYFKLLFIKDIPQAKMLNFGPNSPYDGRTRISVLKFYLKKDTVSVLMLNHGPNIFYDYNLIRKNNIWLVTKRDIESGGRREYYGFEKDQWYLDLKKKIKPVKPMFPPPEPRD
jgi:hypothetical protein